MTYLWVDDVRPPPDDHWIAVDTVTEARRLLRLIRWDVVSLDHDMGGDEDTRSLVLLWCNEPELWPGEVRVHSQNPVGARWLRDMVARYKPQVHA